MDMVAQQGAIKCTLWPASRKTPFSISGVIKRGDFLKIVLYAPREKKVNFARVKFDARVKRGQQLHE